MATYCIGDVHGCYTELQKLLAVINYDTTSDHLWFVGDLVNRGPQSLEALRFVKELPNVKVMLGNHDLYLIVFVDWMTSFAKETFVDKCLQPILDASYCRDLIDWLRKQPLIHYSSEYNCAVVHAGIYPGWDLHEALIHAAEVTELLGGVRNAKYYEFLRRMYGNHPSKWYDSLKDWDRLRFIINSFTRMRFCDLDGNLQFATKDFNADIASAPSGYLPWFKMPWRKTRELKIIFGHWAALEGKTHDPYMIALDTGCVWGGSLTALRLDDNKRFSIP